MSQGEPSAPPAPPAPPAPQKLGYISKGGLINRNKAKIYKLNYIIANFSYEKWANIDAIMDHLVSYYKGKRRTKDNDRFKKTIKKISTDGYPYDINLQYYAADVCKYLENEIVSKDLMDKFNSKIRKRKTREEEMIEQMDIDEGEAKDDRGPEAESEVLLGEAMSLYEAASTIASTDLTAIDPENLTFADVKKEMFKRARAFYAMFFKSTNLAPQN